MKIGKLKVRDNYCEMFKSISKKYNNYNNQQN